MRIKSLKIFCDLVETKSFVGAARRNGITQSAVSQLLFAMEEYFKSRLVDRGRKDFRLTRDGDVVFEYSKRIVQIYDTFQKRFDELKREIPPIRIATTSDIGLYDLQPSWKRFQQENPKETVLVNHRQASQVIQEVLDDVVDLGLLAYRPRHSELAIIPLRKDPLVLICHPQHPLAGQKTVKIKALNTETFVGFGEGTPTRVALGQILRRSGVKTKHVLEFGDIDLIKQVVEAAAGVAIVPELAVQQEVANQTLAVLSIADGVFYRPLIAIHRKYVPLSPSLKQFLATLRQTP